MSDGSERIARVACAIGEQRIRVVAIVGPGPIPDLVIGKSSLSVA